MSGSFNKAVICYVALGSNLGDSLEYLENAVTALQLHPSVAALQLSQTYKSKPHGPQDQPDYFNAAVKFETSLSAENLLDLLQEIENDNKRKRKGVVCWGARTLDLDLLFYSDEKINTKRLIVPHPRICERAFVLLPLRDLNADNLKLNQTDTIINCIDKLSEAELKDCISLDEENKNG